MGKFANVFMSSWIKLLPEDKELIEYSIKNIHKKQTRLNLSQRFYLICVHVVWLDKNRFKAHTPYCFVILSKTAAIVSFSLVGRTQVNKNIKSEMKKILVIGSGFVSEPLVEYLSRDSNISLILASALKDQAEAVAAKYPRVEPVLLDVIGQPDQLSELIRAADIVVSLLPPSLHPTVAVECIKAKVSMVTASYCLPPLAALSEDAKNAGIALVNEVGLDPGIDHLLAMELFDEIHLQGGKVESFVSYCGGLPAPEASNNALRYKFSWSPRCALLNTLNSAKFLKDGELVEVPEGGALMDCLETKQYLPDIKFEGHPNRDSLMYKQLYGILEAKSILRGTLRYQGSANAVKALHQLGLTDPKPHCAFDSSGPEVTWRQLISKILHHEDNIPYDHLKKLLLEKFEGDEQKLETIDSLGLLDDVVVQKMDSPLDTLSNFLSKKLAFGKGERDLVVLSHEVQVLWADGKRELREITLIAYGDPSGYSAMAKTVGYTAAIATKMVLHGEIQQTGTVFPFAPEIYQPMLRRLNAEGIAVEKKSTLL